MKDEKIVVPQSFIVKIEATVPCTLTYRVLAIDAEDAFKKCEKQSPIEVKHHLLKKKNIKAQANKPGTLNVVGTKNYK